MAKIDLFALKRQEGAETMSLSSSQIMGSRSAPRDQEDISGRRPVSVFHDRRQYRMAEDSDEEDRMPPRKESALSSKDKHYRTKAIHRSFASTPAAARFSPARPHARPPARPRPAPRSAPSVLAAGPLTLLPRHAARGRGRAAVCRARSGSDSHASRPPCTAPAHVFAVVQCGGRASARSQVDDIVSGGDESDDNFRERLHKELDADRIARFALPPCRLAGAGAAALACDDDPAR